MPQRPALPSIRTRLTPCLLAAASLVALPANALALGAAPASAGQPVPARVAAAQTGRMGAYTGQSPSAIPQELRERARFLDEQLRERRSPPDVGCVVLQTPAPGEPLGGDTPIAFLVASSVPTPQFQGLSLAAAQQLAEQFCLSVTVVASCSGDSDAAVSSAPNSIVTAQCTPPEALTDIGGQIGVVVSPADDPQPLFFALFLAAAVLAALAAAFALVFYARYSAARDELAIFKSPRREKK